MRGKNEFSGYDAKTSKGKVLILGLRECGVPLIAITSWFTLTWRGRTFYDPIYGSKRTL